MVGKLFTSSTNGWGEIVDFYVVFADEVGRMHQIQCVEACHGS